MPTVIQVRSVAHTWLGWPQKNGSMCPALTPHSQAPQQHGDDGQARKVHQPGVARMFSTEPTAAFEWREWRPARLPAAAAPRRSTPVDPTELLTHAAAAVWSGRTRSGTSDRSASQMFS